MIAALVIAVLFVGGMVLEEASLRVESTAARLAMLCAAMACVIAALGGFVVEVVT